MDPNGVFARSFDESLIRELPHLRIAPLRDPVSSRSLRIPLTLEPNASGVREPTTISKASGSVGILPPRNEVSGTVIESSNAIRLKKNEFAPESLLDPPPRPILPAFVNPRALERFPYSSFDDDNLQSRKRRRVELQSESFGEHLQLPIPQTQKEQRPPPFGPFAILNGLNEPPPNAALLPPIEAGSMTQLLTKPFRDSIVVEPTLLATSSTPERREGRIAEILDSPIAKKPSPNQSSLDNGKANKSELERDSAHIGEEPHLAMGTNKPLSPKARGRSRRNIRKWTDEETIDLLHGVIKCGIGNWKEILAQPGLNFDKRSSSNLKDRFRVCCPWAYQSPDPNEAIRYLRDALDKALSRAESDSSAKKFHIPQPFPADPGPLASLRTPGLTQSGSSSSFSSTETSQNSPEHHPRSRSVLEDALTLPDMSKSSLEHSGFPDPHHSAKFRRRSRRPFTAAEDEALLKGYAVHGFQWTLIQQDKRLNLGHRKATDLRDRFRTKFPDAYRDGGSVSGGTLQAQMTKDEALTDGTNRGPKSKPDLQNSTRTSNGRSGKPGNIILSTSVAVDPVLPSPVPPRTTREGFTGISASGFPFPDEISTNATGVDLPPLVWDDIP
ncbi:hypothetical protein BDW59DRAFT_140593 [Aspergillus cavernicola]|uniref:Myb-like domain-containing protein n=1 Tax=Aspergillus cavernicola TaxID=176166 RepID=A0ABR4ITT2_9EURO